MKVKICGITNYRDAKKAIEEKADYLGIILAPNAKRYLDDKKAFELIQKLQHEPVDIVGVFEETNYLKLAKRAKDLNLKWIQLLAPLNKEALSLLRFFNKLLVIPVNEDGSYLPLNYSLDEKDCWVYDCKSFGEGKPFDWSAFQRKEEGPFFIAGGLNTKNVQEAAALFNPIGVDVSTGVCDHSGILKDRSLIKGFIKKAKTKALTSNKIKEFKI